MYYESRHNEKLSEITNLPQFEKLVKTRKNEKHPIFKEEERIVTVLKDLMIKKKINKAMFEKLKPTGSQPARLYGLAKIHKINILLRPVLSMPGSAYYNIANQVAKWLFVVEECNVNSSTNEISDKLSNIELNENEELVSFDVKSLYTNVPLQEAINDCTELLYSGKYAKPPVDRTTFKELVILCSSDVVLLSNGEYYKQVDGLAMGSLPAPLLANELMNKYDKEIKGEAKLYSRYMDDVLREIHKDKVEEKLKEINNLNSEFLQFTI